MVGKTQNLAPMWKKLMKHVDLDEPTSFLDHKNLGCTQRECKPNETIIERYTQMFESRISAGATEKIQGGKSLTQEPWPGPTTCMEGHARKCIERYCELANKKVEQLYTISSPCLDDHLVVREQFGKISHTMACDRRLARLISYNHHTNEFRQHCRVGNTAQHCGMGLFQDSDFAGDLEDSKSTSGKSLMYLRKSNIRPHQLDVQETNCCLAQFYRVCNHFSGCWIMHGWTTCSRSLGRGMEVLCSTNDTARQSKLAQGNFCTTGDHSITKHQTKTPTCQ